MFEMLSRFQMGARSLHILGRRGARRDRGMKFVLHQRSQGHHYRASARLLAKRMTRRFSTISFPR